MYTWLRYFSQHVPYFIYNDSTIQLLDYIRSRVKTHVLTFEGSSSFQAENRNRNSCRKWFMITNMSTCDPPLQQYFRRTFKKNRPLVHIPKTLKRIRHRSKDRQVCVTLPTGLRILLRNMQKISTGALTVLSRSWDPGDLKYFLPVWGAWLRNAEIELPLMEPGREGR